jgi:hypothetical protein
MREPIRAWALVWSDLGLARVTTSKEDADSAEAGHPGMRAVELAEAAPLRAEVERLRMDAGRQLARCAVFMQAMSWLARNGYQERAKKFVERADAAAADVRPEDFVVAKPCGADAEETKR